MLAERLDAQIAVLRGDVRMARDQLHRQLESDWAQEDLGGDLDLFVWHGWACLWPGMEDAALARRGLSLAVDSMHLSFLDTPRLYEVAAGFFCLTSCTELAAKALVSSEAMRALTGLAVHPAEEENLKRTLQAVASKLGANWRRQLSDGVRHRVRPR
jgi:hypothetical protein